MIDLLQWVMGSSHENDIDKLGIFHANQTYMCLDPQQN